MRTGRCGFKVLPSSGRKPARLFENRIFLTLPEIVGNAHWCTAAKRPGSLPAYSLADTVVGADIEQATEAKESSASLRSSRRIAYRRDDGGAPVAKTSDRMRERKYRADTRSREESFTFK